MAQFEKVGTEIYGNTAHNVDQGSYNPVAHESINWSYKYMRCAFNKALVEQLVAFVLV
jgi:hypothetical protein